jgi:ubiquinone/menaquinone biosynthesis C-methylase UbiE
MSNDYRDSHKGTGKGASYNKSFREFPFRSVLWEMEQQFLLRIVENFTENTDVNHLDFACGTGRIVGFLADHVKSSVGIDLSDSMLAIAQKELPNTELIKADITTSDVLNDRTFNLITAFRFFSNAQPDA